MLTKSSLSFQLKSECLKRMDMWKQTLLSRELDGSFQTKTCHSTHFIVNPIRTYRAFLRDRWPFLRGESVSITMVSPRNAAKFRRENRSFVEEKIGKFNFTC